MYEETLKRKTVRGFKSFLGIIISVFGTLALLFLVGYLQRMFAIYYPQYILLAGIVLLGIMAVRSLITEYVYIITQDGVRIIRKIGEKPKIFIEFPFGDIIRYGSRSEVSGAAAGKRKLKAIIGKENPDAVYIVLPGKIVVLNPTGVFTQKLKEVYEKTCC